MGEPDATGLKYMISFQEEFQGVHALQDEVGEGLAIRKGRWQLGASVSPGKSDRDEAFFLEGLLYGESM